MGNIIYLRMRPRIEVQPNTTITILDLAHIIASESIKEKLYRTEVYQITKNDKNFVILDVMHVVKVINSVEPGLEVQVVGPSQTVVEVQYKLVQRNIISIIAVWLLLFFGAGLAIMNFHADVSMREVHQNIYYLITGKEVAKPLILQIPYSFGLGLGMILFFNHLFRKRLNEEPSPLEIEMFNYQQDLDQYLIVKENKGRMK